MNELNVTTGESEEAPIMQENELKALLTKNIKIRDHLVNNILTRSNNKPDLDDIQAIVKLLDGNDKVALTQLKIKSDEKQNKLGRDSALMVANALKQLDMRDLGAVRTQIPQLPAEIDITDKVTEEDFVGVKTFTYEEIMDT